MTGGGGGRGPPPPSPSPASGGEFLLQLLQKPQQSQTQNPINSTSPPSHVVHLPHHLLDPAVAAMGPSFPFPSNGHDHSPPPWMSQTSFAGHPTPNNTPWGSAGLPPPPNLHLAGNFPPISADDFHRLGLLGGNGRLGHQPRTPQQQRRQPEEHNNMVMFGSVPTDFRNHGGVLNGNLLDQRSLDVNMMSVEALFSAQKVREVAGANASLKSSEIWCNPNQDVVFDHELNSHDRHQWSNSPEGGAGGGRRQMSGDGDGGRGRRQQPLQLRTSPMVEPRSTPPGFSQKQKRLDQWGPMNTRWELEGNVDKPRDSWDNLNHQAHQSYNKDEVIRTNSPTRRGNQGNASSRLRLSGQLDHPGLPGGSKLWSVSASDIEESLATLHGQVLEEDGGRNFEGHENRSGDEAHGAPHQVSGRSVQDDLSEQLMNSVRLSNGLQKNISGHDSNFHDKAFRLGMSRELHPPGQRMRNNRRPADCRNDIDRMNTPFLAIFESLVPAEEEKAKQKQLLMSLEKLVNKEWPRAQLYLYGSCANSFGVSKSDIDVCLAIEDEDVNKSELLLKLAEILQEDNLQNVQALTRARVPIVKLMDPVTGISCDICVNNVLAVVNTKLLRDYAQIDGRLRQLAFIVKHWAKSRGVNVTYHGTLSSYAYVLMCIHFLQQRTPAILPCLQGMEATYVVNVDDIECAYFDQVQNLCDFGARNKERIAQLVWAFFDYWAYRHDYANAVISVRTGTILSKRAKDWTRRIGNDRHLICIEDPFETSHDLGRVVDKYSIKILRQEFERAANIMQYDADPCVTLFEPYVPNS